jgi:thiol-disulfide isomerase/thioredoxin
MKKILLGAALLLATGISAQTYFQDDFSGAITAKWSLTDSDGDNQNWEATNFNGPQGQVASSASWTSTLGPLTPDNWMISNAIDLTSATGVTKLSWLVKGQDQQFPAENYSVYVGTSNATVDMLANGADFTEVMIATNDQYVSRNIDLSSFNGSTVYVAFRHHGVTDEFRLNVDDVMVAKVPNNDLALTGMTVDGGLIGNRTFSINVKNMGLTAVTSFDLAYTFDGGTPITENVTGINLAYTQSHTINVTVNGVTMGAKDLVATITTTDDVAANNIATTTFNFLPPVPQFVGTDSDGNSFDLHDRLENGQAIILDFMASWCGPCQSSTPALSELVENNGSGTGKVEALAISVEATDNAAVLNGLNWNGGFYAYPKFPYTVANNNSYFHYAINHGFNTGGSIPFFVMICPNITDPELSTIIKQDVGYGAGMFGAYQTALDQCPTATMDVIELAKEDINFKVFPNPTSNVVNVEFELQNQNDVTVSILNTVGQTVATNNLGTVSGVQATQLDVSSLESGMYIVKVKTANGEQTKRISVIR